MECLGKNWDTGGLPFKPKLMSRLKMCSPMFAQAGKFPPREVASHWRSYVLAFLTNFWKRCGLQRGRWSNHGCVPIAGAIPRRNFTWKSWRPKQGIRLLTCFGRGRAQIAEMQENTRNSGWPAPTTRNTPVCLSKRLCKNKDKTQATLLVAFGRTSPHVVRTYFGHIYAWTQTSGIQKPSSPAANKPQYLFKIHTSSVGRTRI